MDEQQVPARGEVQEGAQARVAVFKYTYLLVCTHVDGGLKSTSSVFQNWPLPYFLRQGLSVNLEFTDSAQLASQGVPGNLWSPPPQGWNYSQPAWRVKLWSSSHHKLFTK